MHEIGQTLQLHHYPAEVSQDGSAPWCYRRTTCREQAIPYADRMEWLDGLLRGAFGGLAMETLRRRNPHGPLADTRGAAGRTHAIAHAIRAGLVAGESPEEIEERIRAAEEAGLPSPSGERDHVGIEAVQPPCIHQGVQKPVRTRFLAAGTPSLRTGKLGNGGTAGRSVPHHRDVTASEPIRVATSDYVSRRG